MITQRKKISISIHMSDHKLTKYTSQNHWILPLIEFFSQTEPFDFAHSWYGLQA